MEAVTRFFQKLIGTARLQRRPPKTRFDFSRFAEGDRVTIKGRKPRLSKSLQHGGKFDLPDGFICHDEIIGALPGQSVRTNAGKLCRITFPDLDSYISSVPRKVTPIYSNYANYIVSLLDIHVTPPTYAADKQPPLEILETGTGHGSVTLSLARAIQAANPPIPVVDWGAIASSGDITPGDSSYTSLSDGEMHSVQVWQEWRNSRRAIVHSVEISRTYSKHAEKKVVGSFRRGLYLPHIDFHIANIVDWIDEQLERRQNVPFLSYVVLDMPGCHRYLKKVASATKEDALIAVFVPSVTQISDCIREISATGLPLRMEKTLELGEGISNGRQWDVRLAVKRARDYIDESGAGNVEESEDGQGMVGQDIMQLANGQTSGSPDVLREGEKDGRPPESASSRAVASEEPVNGL